ncbi:kinase-like domain-containing protein [Gigaspora rosea]|uniref:Kinase-like domain-containing protein n=1 Tax=Gigaspora rosea TaxID=44941 RepID=A0A397UIU8_9GLOM|nr:kinase-like domain-containing protein [Gigaspora rosea]
MALNKPDPTFSNFTAALNTATISSNAVIDCVSLYIPIFEVVKRLVDEIHQIYENAECNKEICSIMTDRVKTAEFSIGIMIRNIDNNSEGGDLRKKSYYNAFKRFETALIKIKDFTQNVSKLEGFKKFTNAKIIKAKYETLIDEFDKCMKDLHFSIDIDAIINRENDAQKVDKALNDAIQLLNNLGKDFKEIKEIVRDVGIMKAQINDQKNNQTNEIQVEKINENDLENPPSSKVGDVRENGVVRKIYKKFSVDVACKPESKSKCETQLAILGLLGQSPHILRFYGLTTLNNRRNMVNEWAEYGNLKELYNRFDIPWTRKIQIIREICRGILFLRTVNIFHHDLRCKNIFVLDNLNIKIGNFKCARKEEADTTSLGDLYLNVINWMAPELMEKYQDLNKRKNEKVYTFNCEMFSFGMLMWELCYEKVPYDGWKMPQIVEHVLSGKREDVLKGKFKHSDDLEIQKNFISIINKAWKQSPDLRISITELYLKLEEFAGKYPVPPNAPPLLDNNELDLDGKKNQHQVPIESLYPEFDDPDEIIEEEDIIMSLEEGIKMHRNGDRESAWKCFEQNSELPLAKFWKGLFAVCSCWRSDWKTNEAESCCL